MLAALLAAKRQDEFTQVLVNLSGEGSLDIPVDPPQASVVGLDLTGPMAVPSTVWRLAKLIQQTSPCAIQSWLYYADLISLWALGFSGRRRSTRFYWGVRNSELNLNEYGRALRWSIAACAYWSHRPDAVIANSVSGREAHRRLGYQPRVFSVIPNGIDTHRYRPDPAARVRIRAELGLSDDTPLVIHAGRRDPMKDHESLIRVAVAMPNIRFIMVGSGTESLRPPSNVIALGLRHDMPALYAAADVALSTSAFGEAFSNVLGEAMASGIPVVTTAVGDAPYIVGETGFMVQPRDIAAMTGAIHRVVAMTTPEREQRGASCRERIQTFFSRERMIASFDDLHLRGILPACPAG